MKVKIISSEVPIPYGTIVEVRECNCGNCSFTGNGDGYYKLVSTKDLTKYPCTEIDRHDVVLINTKVNHLPDWL